MSTLARRRIVPGTKQLIGYFSPNTLGHTEQVVLQYDQELAARNRLIANAVANKQLGAVYIPSSIPNVLGSVHLPNGSTQTLSSFFTPTEITSLGITSAATAIGSLALGALAIPLDIYNVVQELQSLFSGKPKLQDTAQAVVRLAQSHNPAVQQLARNLVIYLRNGVPLSTSNPAQQAQLRDWIAGTISTIGQELGTSLNPAQVSSLDQSIHNVLESEVANSGTMIDRTINQIASTRTSMPMTTTTTAVQPYIPPPLPPRPRVLGRPGRQTSPAITQPQQQQSYSHNPIEALKQFALQHLYLSVGGCLATLTINPEVTAKCLEGFLATQLEDTVKTLVDNALNYIHSLQYGNQTQPLTLGNQPSTTPSPAPMLDQQSDCPGCDRVSRQIAQQRQQLQREITTETTQNVEQQLTKTEQELTQFAKLETQPTSTRNIPKELQQKQALADQLIQLQQEENQVTTQQTIQQTQPTPGQPAPTLTQDHTEQLSQDQQAATHFSQQVQQELPSPEVSFCVGCQSQEDAILFLNGEPSKCSVIPGSTKSLNTTQ